MGHDQDDSKILSQSMAHEIIPYQDQVANLFSQALYLMKIQSMLVIGVDTDMLTEPQRNHIKKIMQGAQYYSEALLVEHSASDQRDLFQEEVRNKTPITLTQTQAQISAVINELLNNVNSIINMLEKNQMLSPQELGQFSARETTAQEVFEVSQTTNALHAYVSEGPDEYRAAMKRILHDSVMALASEEDFNVYVQEKYPDKVITSAGFKPRADTEIEGYQKAEDLERNIVGSVNELALDVVYNSRDGSERTVSTQAAKVLGDLTRYVFGTPEIFQIFVQNYGMEQITNMISEVFRLSGSGFILKVPASTQPQERQLASLVEQLSQAQEQSAQNDEAQEQQISQLKAQIDLIAQQLSPVEPVLPAEEDVIPAPPDQGGGVPPAPVNPEVELEIPTVLEG
jgi:hypothetical protein